MGANAGSLGSAYVTIRGDLRPLGASLDDALRKVKGFEGSLTSSNSRLAASYRALGINSEKSIREAMALIRKHYTNMLMSGVKSNRDLVAAREARNAALKRLEDQLNAVEIEAAAKRAKAQELENQKNAQYWTARLQFEKRQVAEAERSEAEVLRVREAARQKDNEANAQYWLVKRRFEKQQAAEAARSMEAARQKDNEANAQYWIRRMAFEKQQVAEAARAEAEVLRVREAARQKENEANAQYWVRRMAVEKAAREKLNQDNAAWWMRKIAFDKAASEKAAKEAAASWNILGIKSSAMMQQQKKEIEAAYAHIVATSKKGSADVVAAEKAKNARIAEINRGLVHNYESTSAAITRAILRIYAAYYVVSQGARLLTAPFEKGFRAVDEFKSSIIELAALAAQFSRQEPGQSAAEHWEASLEYAKGLVPVVERIAAITQMSGVQANALMTAFMRSGVFLDAQNKKQVEGFQRLANILPTITRGQEIMRQINTEMRAVLEGTGRVSSVLYKTLIRIDPKLDEHLALWTKENTVIEHMGELLWGVGQASELIALQWNTIKTSLDTSVNQILREAMLPVYDDIIAKMKEVTDALQDQKGLQAEIVSSLRDKVWKAYVDIKNILKDIRAGFEAFKVPLGFIGEATSYVVDGWGMLLASMTPVLDRMGSGVNAIFTLLKGNLNYLIATVSHLADILLNILDSLWNAGEATIHLLQSAKNVAMGNLVEAGAEIDKMKDSFPKAGEALRAAFTMEDSDRTKKFYEGAEKDWEDAGKLWGKATAKGIFDEIDKGLAEYNKKFKSEIVDGQAPLTPATPAAEFDAKKIDKMLKAEFADVDKYREIIKKFYAANEKLIKSLERFNKKSAGFKVFGDGALKDIKDVISALEKMASTWSSIVEVQKDAAKLQAELNNPTPFTDVARAEEQLALLREESLSMQLAGYTQLAGSISKMFKENSDARKAFHTLEMTLAIAEMAIEAKKVALSIAGYTKTAAAAVAAAAKAIAANTASAISGAVASIANQGQIPIIGFALVAAMAALMGTVLAKGGMSFGGIGGGGGGGSSAAYHPAQYTGTVLGDAEAESESVSNITDMLESVHADEYPELQGIHQEMIELNNNITGLVSSIVRGGTFQGGEMSSYAGSVSDFINSFADSVSEWISYALTPRGIIGEIFGDTGAQVAGLLDPGGLLVEWGNDLLGGLVDDLIGSLIGGSGSVRIHEIGLTLGEMTVDSLLDGVDAAVSQYTILQKKRKRGWLSGGGTRTTLTDPILETVDEQTQRLFTSVFLGLSESLMALGTSLGADVEAIQNYVFDIGNINLRDLSAEEINDRLQAVISTAADTAAEALFTGIEQYQQVGEGLFETAARLVIDKEVVLSALDSIGMGFVGLANSLEAIDFAESLLSLSGDLESFASSVGKFYTSFFSPSEQLSQLGGGLSSVLANHPILRSSGDMLGLSALDSVESLKEVVAALDLTTEAGRDAFTAIMSNVDAFKSFFDLTDEKQAALDGVTEGMADFFHPLSDYGNLVVGVREKVQGWVETMKEWGVSVPDEAGMISKAIGVATGRFASDIEQGISDAISKEVLSSEDYQVLQATRELESNLTTIAELGPDYAYLEGMAQKLYDTQLEGIKKVTAAQEAANYRSFRTTQLSVAGFSEQEIRLTEMGSKYGWRDAGVINSGGLDWGMIQTALDSFGTMTFQEFTDMTDSWGMEWQDVLSDIQYLGDIINGEFDDFSSKISAWGNIADALGNQILGLRTGLDNPQDVYERIGIQEQAIADVLGGRSITDYIMSLETDEDRMKAVTNLQELFGGRLSLYQEGYDRPSDAYMGAFQETLTSLGTLKSIAEGFVTDYDLQVQQVDWLQVIAENTSGLADIPQFDTGGFTSGGLVFTHPNELILNPEQQMSLLMGATAPQQGGGDTYVNIKVEAHGGDSNEVSEQVVSKMASRLAPYVDRGGTLRTSIRRAANGPR